MNRIGIRMNVMLSESGLRHNGAIPEMYSISHAERTGIGGYEQKPRRKPLAPARSFA